MNQNKNCALRNGKITYKGYAVPIQGLKGADHTCVYGFTDAVSAPSEFTCCGVHRDLPSVPHLAEAQGVRIILW